MNSEVEVIHSSGCIPLADFPHARFHCHAIPFHNTSAFKTCPNCFCYACDLPVANCNNWNVHCHATSSSEEWRTYRKNILLDRKNKSKSSFVNQSSLSTSSSTSSSSSSSSSLITLIPPGTAHGPHAAHLHDVGNGYSYLSTTTTSVPVKTNLTERVIHRKARGTFCKCCTTSSSNEDYTNDGIFRTIDFHNYLNLKKHSAVSGPGVKYDEHITGDYETCWECKICGYPPICDISIMLNRQKAAWLLDNRK